MKRISNNAVPRAVAPSGPPREGASPPKRNNTPPRRADAPLLPLAGRNLAAMSRPAGTLGSRLAPLPQCAAQSSPPPTPATGGWNPLSRLKAEELTDIPETAIETLKKDLNELYKEVKDKKLDYVPVFGYLSLRYRNFHELGKNSQDEVREGQDWLPATLREHALDFVMSTQYRGHHQHPGVVAGLSSSGGGTMEGVILKLPVDNAEELLARVIRRELLDENDLVHPTPCHGQSGTGQSSSAGDTTASPPSPRKPRSNLMYSSAVRPVTLPDGATTVKALVFVTNPDSAKSLATVFKDSSGVSAQRLAYFMTSKGSLGGPSIDYWKHFVDICQKTATPVPPKVLQAIELAERWPDAFSSKRAAQDDAAQQRVHADWLREMAGAAAPRRVWLDRKPEL
ncbi:MULTISPECIES: gamma-glutamylcyclotransferase [Ralstonia solanacearum species complex]|uniref:gamma-glutamylcyclotransferase n=1 Tax=Ralstonia solanacearum species complex TaxID=3116862 RepID=UPI000E575A41|nr:gamma-glutamylcyclotransferase [Ralstonia solanacearum]AXV79397.1 type III effector protein [Ralstonia solanacearum]AXV93419.1 type III effector protein [Ralstonia solanacearum]AXW78308.1 type III effector protein [Ralstonia solanacearum]